MRFMALGKRPFKNGHSYSPKTALYQHNCNWCGPAFSGSMDKTYCSDACRLNAWRERQRGPSLDRPITAKQTLPIAWGSVRFHVLHRDGFKCRYCGRGANENVVLHVDHFNPRANGGGNEIDNLVTACAECNLGKGSTIIQTRP